MAAVVRSRTLAVINPTRPPIAICLGPVYVSRRQQSTNIVKGQHANPAAYKRGRGGRSSFSGTVATVFGASGFLGRYVVNRLGKIGSQIIVPYRGDPYFCKDLKVAGDLGQVLFVPFYLRDDESIRKSMKYSNVVINLIGRDWETKNFKFDDVNVEGPRRIARLAKEAGVEKFIHVSHLNAQPDPPPILMKGGSKYLQSKYYGELAVKEEFPEAVIFKPADIYGPEDRFLRYYASSWRRAGGKLPLWKRGTETIKMPVFCSNVAEGIVKVTQDPEIQGRTYECVGPESYYLSDLTDYMYDCMRYRKFKRTFLSPFFKMKVMFMARAPAYPILTMDKLSREHVSDQVEGHDTLEDLGVELTKIEHRVPFEMKPFRLYRYYEEKLGEIPNPSPPPTVSSYSVLG